MIQTIDFAPLDGITKIVFRQVWSQFFGGVDRYFIPFFSPTPHHLMTPRDLREVDYIHNTNLPSVPQVMTKSADDILWACEVHKDMGYTEVNLNLGCPSGTVTAKGLKTACEDGKLVIVQEGAKKKFVNQVEHITFSGKYAVQVKQPVLYITERAVFELRPEGVTLIEIAPGIDLQTQVLDQMEFMPKIAEDLKLMDERIFKDELMGLAEA